MPNGWFINMLGRVLLAFAIVPLIEIFVLIKIGSVIGALNTILLLIAMAMLGTLLARLEGLRTLRQIQASLAEGQVPAEELIDGVLIFIAGILLVIPGILSDLLGLVLLVPFTRTHFKRWLRRRFDRMTAAGHLRLHYDRGGSHF
jgi:UPF0716 protein FxsA